MTILDGVSDELIEHARQTKNVPADWAVEWCANFVCGDFVFYPPDAQRQAVEQGTPFVIVCSQECMAQVMQTRPVADVKDVRMKPDSLDVLRERLELLSGRARRAKPRP